MGLDQYAYKRTKTGTDPQPPADFTWRKHSKLQEFMEQLFAERVNQNANLLNNGELELQRGDIDLLEDLVTDRDLPTCEGGFFYGHEYQDAAAECARDQDLAFCAWASERTAPIVAPTLCRPASVAFAQSNGPSVRTRVPVALICSMA